MNWSITVLYSMITTFKTNLIELNYFATHSDSLLNSLVMYSQLPLFAMCLMQITEYVLLWRIRNIDKTTLEIVTISDLRDDSENRFDMKPVAVVSPCLYCDSCTF
jgi:hypothetical protein